MQTEQDIRSAFANVPSNRFFGFSLVTRSSEYAEVALPLNPSFTQEVGVVHGGVITALADTTAVYALYPELPDDQTMTSIELKMNFLRPVRLPEGELRAVARVVKKGRSVAVCDIDVFQKKLLVAKGLFSYLILSKPA